MAALTHKGMVRTNNEDALFFDTNARVSIVCDGMGGHAGGQVASELAVQVVSNALRTIKPKDFTAEDRVIETITQAVFGANDHILNRAMVDTSLFDMGTTLVALVFMYDRVITANIGDSRIYRICENEIEQVSEDHSLVQEKIKAGEIEADSAEAKMLSNILTRALGMDRITVDITVEDMHAGDIYLLCTDGLTDMVSDATIRDIILEYESDLQAASMALIEIANSNGGNDNITVALTRCDGPQPL